MQRQKVEIREMVFLEKNRGNWILTKFHLLDGDPSRGFNGK
jgi:hypothetical protein